jgi:hypothetical protein
MVWLFLNYDRVFAIYLVIKNIPGIFNDGDPGELKLAIHFSSYCFRCFLDG